MIICMQKKEQGSRQGHAWMLMRLAVHSAQTAFMTPAANVMNGVSCMREHHRHALALESGGCAPTANIARA